MKTIFKFFLFITVSFNFSAFSAKLDEKSKKSLEKAFNKYIKKEISRIKPFLKGNLKEVNKQNLKKASNDRAFYDNLIFSIYESNRWFLLKNLGMDRDFSVIHEGCRKFMYNNPEYSPILKKSPRYRPFSYADYLTGQTFGCLYHKNSKGRMKYRKEVHQAKEIVLFILRDQKVLQQLQEANLSIGRDLGSGKTSFQWKSLFMAQAHAGLKQKIKDRMCAIGTVPIWLVTFPVLMSLDYSIFLPFTIYNLSKGKKGTMETGGLLSKDYTFNNAYETCKKAK